MMMVNDRKDGPKRVLRTGRKKDQMKVMNESDTVSR